MSERLLKIAAEADPMETPFLNREAAEIFGRQLQAALAQNSPEDRSTKLVGPRFRYALELLNSGESEKAIAQFRLL